MLNDMKNSQVILLSVLLGLIWGGATQWFLTTWRHIPIIGDNGIGTALLWFGGLLLLLGLVAANRAPAMLGWIGATFWVSAVVGYYAIYIGLLAVGSGEQGTAFDFSQWGTYRGLWDLFKRSIIVWLALGFLGGFGTGWIWSKVQRWRSHTGIGARE